MHIAIPSAHGPQHAMRGVTLLELLIVVAIVGILAAVGYPAYSDYVIRANRGAAKSMMLQVADRQEQFFADRKQYAADLTDLGYLADPFGVTDQGTPTAAAAADRIYAISLTNTGAFTYTVNAVPQLRQAAHDVDCQTLTLTHTGIKDQTGAGTNCW